MSNVVGETLLIDQRTFQQEHGQYKHHVRNQRCKSYPQLRLEIIIGSDYATREKKRKKRTNNSASRTRIRLNIKRI